MSTIKFNSIRCQKYLTDRRLNPSESKLIFQLRTRMFPVKENFKNKVQQQGKNFNCEMCKINRDDQKHLLQCPILKNLVPELKNTTVTYEDIFGDIDKLFVKGKLFHPVPFTNGYEKLLLAY